MSIEITFVRHGETDANAASIWQGQGDAALSDLGRRQAVALGKRLGSQSFDAVISSDLIRTVTTAELAGLDFVQDPAWREMDIGDWEGLTRGEVHERFPSQIKRLGDGDPDTRMGGGESWREFGNRISAAVDRLVEATPPGSRVLVVAHGGVIHAALSRGLGLSGRRPWPIARIRNTAVTEVIASEDGFHLQILNDARHAAQSTSAQENNGAIALIRHGETEANVAGRWHGRTDGPLTANGATQGAALSETMTGVAKVVASPLQRTRLTAEAFAARSGLTVETVDDLIEIDFGAWEDLTTSQIEERFPEEFDRVFLGGEDLPRGGTGETFGAAGSRMAAAVAALANDHPGRTVAAFTHGGTIWALASRMLGIEWTAWRSLAMPSNVSTTHVRFDETGSILVDYNLPL